MSKEKKNRVVFGECLPEHVNQINYDYIHDFFADGLKNGTITREEVDAFYKELEALTEKKDEKGKVIGVRSPVEYSVAVRKHFAEKYMPEILPAKKKGQYSILEMLKEL